jgi:hypothetical protein
MTGSAKRAASNRISSLLPPTITPAPTTIAPIPKLNAKPEFNRIFQQITDRLFGRSERTWRRNKTTAPAISAAAKQLSLSARVARNEPHVGHPISQRSGTGFAKGRVNAGDHRRHYAGADIAAADAGHRRPAAAGQAPGTYRCRHPTWTVSPSFTNLGISGVALAATPHLPTLAKTTEVNPGRFLSPHLCDEPGVPSLSRVFQCNAVRLPRSNGCSTHMTPLFTVVVDYGRRSW